MFGTRQIDCFGAALLAVVFLLPVGDSPWFSFWREWTASVAVLFIVLGAVSRLRFERRPIVLDLASLASLALLLAVVPWLQWACGITFYRGDVLLVSAYLVGFAVCLTVSRSMAPDDRAALADRLALALLAASLCSVPFAWLQWLGVIGLDLGVKVTAGRPVAHMEQTNLLCSLLIQGLFGAWRLHERGRLPSRWLGAIALALLSTIVLTQSRVAWLVMAVTVLAWAWRRRKAALQCRGRFLVLAALVLGAGTLILPWIDTRFALHGMTLDARIASGRRPDVWRLFLDAASQRPWSGWGTQQVGAAQFAMAGHDAALQGTFASTHDVVLDLVVWFGVPIGLIAGVALLVVPCAQIRRAPDAASFVTAMAAAALALHGLVELPLQYTYFLFPFGLMLGLEGRREGTPARALALPVHGPAGLAGLALAPALLLALLARDYIPLSDSRPYLLYDRPANALVLGSPLPPPDGILLLDQLYAFHLFAAVPDASGVSPATLESMRQPMLRFPYSPGQIHYARVLALNGRAADSLAVIAKTCDFMTSPQCLGIKSSWRVWQAQGEPLPDWP